MHSDRRPIGIICQPDHEMFGPVAGRLRDRGLAVRFLEPGVDLDPEDLDELALLVNKKIRWESLRALEYAHRSGIPTWNGYVPTMLFVNRLSQVHALTTVGFATPDTLVERPTEPSVAKAFLDIKTEPTIDGDDDFYQPLLATDHVDRKYYAIDDGQRVHCAVREFRSKLYDDREYLGPGTVDPTIEDRIARLLRFTGARGVGVDVVHADERRVAVDVNPATSFRRTGLEEAITDSILAAME